eukprot:CAMPEP_0113585262 /NCGR_PEP_ID=MMETSP0015_2-20120614/33589_1 /TAXON_ID=2838 /ORGANISM="Odontella" /LENGTH=75 /DNA_ID=CAMNT_0000490459 /DNA_START=420 /DNA_END=643 /DNA_ORIENTATION=+ /assembly_acc=CAM_ASM_000160
MATMLTSPVGVNNGAMAAAIPAVPSDSLPEAPLGGEAAASKATMPRNTRSASNVSQPASAISDLSVDSEGESSDS